MITLSNDRTTPTNRSHPPRSHLSLQRFSFAGPMSIEARSRSIARSSKRKGRSHRFNKAIASFLDEEAILFETAKLNGFSDCLIERRSNGKLNG